MLYSRSCASVLVSVQANAAPQPRRMHPRHVRDCSRCFLAGNLDIYMRNPHDLGSSGRPRKVVVLVGPPSSTIGNAGRSPCREHLFAQERERRCVVH
jgi:hypothetical protein